MNLCFYINYTTLGHHYSSLNHWSSSNNNVYISIINQNNFSNPIPHTTHHKPYYRVITPPLPWIEGCSTTFLIEFHSGSFPSFLQLSCSLYLFQPLFFFLLTKPIFFLLSYLISIIITKLNNNRIISLGLNSDTPLVLHTTI